MDVQASAVARYADMLAAMGSEARLRIVRLLLAAHPSGLHAGEIQHELGIPASTLSHHLDKLKHEGLIAVRREQRNLRYTASSEALGELLGFLYAECCSRSGAVEPSRLVTIAAADAAPQGENEDAGTASGHNPRGSS
jgi:DNA-binding transcriptional ArsR family regulator